MDRGRDILEILQTGGFHSGEDLARRLDISRAAVWKAIRQLTHNGVPVQAVRGRGYRLAEPLEFLDPARITQTLSESDRRVLHRLEVYQSLDSTNTHLLNLARGGAPGGSVCLAERQTAGRGRRGRDWLSPYAANLYLSLLWRFSTGISALSGLSLAVGVSLAQSLRGLEVPVGLKWPNDLYWQERKLGGILLEFGGEAAGPCFAVVGVGLNVNMPPDSALTLDRPWTDLRTLLGPRCPGRNELAGQVLSAVLKAMGRFEAGGWHALAEQWRALDITAGRRVSLHLPTRTLSGIARGVDGSGALLLETDNGMQRFTAGEVSLRW